MKTKLGEAGIAEYAMPLNIDTESAGSSLELNQFLEKKLSLNFTNTSRNLNPRNQWNNYYFKIFLF